MRALRVLLATLVGTACQATFLDEEGTKVAQLPENAVIVDVASLGGRCDDARTAEEARSTKTPWCTLERALAATPSGWPVRVRAGKYPALVIKTPSTRGVELSLGVFPAETVQLPGAQLSAQQLLAFEGFAFTAAVALGSGNQSLRFSNCDFTTSDGSPALYLQSSVAGLAVSGSHFHDVGKTSDPVSGRGVQGDPGGSDFHFTGNTFEDLGGSGIRVQETSDLTVTGNVFRNTQEPLLLVNVSAVTVSGNRFFGQDAPVGLRSVSQLVMENNLVTGFPLWAVAFAGVNGAVLHNNTVYGNGKGGLDFGSYATSGLTLQNEILQTLDGLNGTPDFEDYNLITAGSHHGAHDLVTTPIFVDASSANFHLGVGSPGIDAALADHAPAADLDGRVREDDPAVPNTGAGTPPYGDLGAFEGH